jgi:hypothetical protein
MMSKDHPPDKGHDKRRVIAPPRQAGRPSASDARKSPLEMVRAASAVRASRAVTSSVAPARRPCACRRSVQTLVRGGERPVRLLRSPHNTRSTPSNTPRAATPSAPPPARCRCVARPSRCPVSADDPLGRLAAGSDPLWALGRTCQWHRSCDTGLRVRGRATATYAAHHHDVLPGLPGEPRPHSCRRAMPQLRRDEALGNGDSRACPGHRVGR